MGNNVLPVARRCLGAEVALTVADSVVAPTAPPAGTRHALMSVTAASATAMRMRTDGTDPSATAGLVLPTGAVYDMFMNADQDFTFALANLEFIRDGAVSCEVNILWFD